MSDKNRSLRKRELWEKQQGRCFYCQRQTFLLPSQPGIPNPPDLATFDHVISKCRLKRKGMTNVQNNKVIACRECNQAKGNMKVEKFLKVLKQKAN